MSESVRRHVAELKTALKGPQPTRLEALLVDQVVVGWLGVQQAEVGAARPAAGSMAHLKRAESAVKRYLSVVRTLATLRSTMPRGMVPIDSPRLFDPRRKLA